MTPFHLLSAIVDYQDHHYADDTFLSVGRVTFKESFGPFQQGEVIESLVLDYVRGYIEECDDKGEVLRKCAVKLVLDPDRKDPVFTEEEEEILASVITN